MLARRRLLVAVGLVLAVATTAAVAELKDSSNYETLAPPQPTLAGGGIEVTEFFWYGCPHCYALEPVLGKWLNALPKDVVFRRVHADFGRWGAGARLYYALEALGEEARLRRELFDAIHLEHLAYTKESELADWLATKGVDRARFSAAYHSSEVDAKVKNALVLTQSHGVDGVPTLVVAGRYRTSPSTVGGHEAMLAVVDELIAKARLELRRR